MKPAGSEATHRHPVGPANRGLPALQKNPLEPGRSERQRPGKLAMGWGPLFLLARTGGGVIVPSSKAQGGAGSWAEGELTIRPHLSVAGRSGKASAGSFGEKGLPATGSVNEQRGRGA